ncbi:uncharacterized protein LOC131000200 [Salvia miltiorrhiza]|uniref:uncharacterized protein LOC131000200 n=1 Tax=Salvia miltiorrhiza TaxID=226208 RepID=UPI0025ACF407|nr:uncharacterized protein LOC131000200 [Salvia miltiorrhiza]XP_057781968.1 uncharacterized protein LOC131000200 [Salvia miltiorrhiza]
MSSQSRSQVAADEEEMMKLEEEVKEMSEKLLDYRTTLPGQLSSTISSLLESQRPVLPAPDAEAGVSQGLMRETTEDSDEAEKLQLLKQKISGNATTMPVVLNRLKEHMARIDALDSSNGIIHPAFKMKRTS